MMECSGGTKVKNNHVSCLALLVLLPNNEYAENFADLLTRHNEPLDSIKNELGEEFLSVMLDCETKKVLPNDFSTKSKEEQEVIFAATKAALQILISNDINGKFNNLCSLTVVFDSRLNLKSRIEEWIEDINSSGKYVGLGEGICNCAKELAQTRRCSIAYCSIVNDTLAMSEKFSSNDIGNLYSVLVVSRDLYFRINHLESPQERRQLSKLRDMLHDLSVYCAGMIKHIEFQREMVESPSIMAKFPHLKERSEATKSQDVINTVIPDRPTSPSTEPLPTLW